MTAKDTLNHFLQNSIIAFDDRISLSFNLFDGQSYGDLSFGAKAGSSISFIDNGFHDFCHAVDFVMTGKITRIGKYDLHFFNNFIEYDEYFGCEVGDPSTTQITDTEVRTFALMSFIFSAYGHHLKSNSLDTYELKNRSIEELTIVEQITPEEFKKDFLNTVCVAGSHIWADMPIAISTIEDGSYGHHKTPHKDKYAEYCSRKFDQYLNEFSLLDVRNAISRLDRIIGRYKRIN